MEKLTLNLEKYRIELIEINKELQTLPDGILIKRRTSYLHAIKGKEIGISTNDQLIRQLCRKKYLLMRQKQLTHNTAILLKFLNEVQSGSLESPLLATLDTTKPRELLKSLPKSYRELPEDYF